MFKNGNDNDFENKDNVSQLRLRKDFYDETANIGPDVKFVFSNSYFELCSAILRIR